MSNRSLFVSLAAIVFTSTAWGADSAPATQPAAKDQGPGFSVTIYSLADPATFDPQQFAAQQASNYSGEQVKLPGYGVVRETRAIDLRAGENQVEFTDVATGIDPTTVSFKSLTAPDSTAVLEQNYEYDLVSADKLLEKSLGKEISLHRQTSPNAASQTVTGTLLSADSGNLVLRDTGGKVQLIPRGADIQDIQVAGEANLVTRPTLIWKIRAEQAGRHNAQVSYQTDSVTWRADYTVTVNKNDTAADVGAWVSIVNDSGASYPDAKLKLVAGNVQRLQPQQNMVFGIGGNAGGRMAAEGFAEKSFFEYHLYTLGRTSTLPNHSTKQIELFPTRSGVSVNKTYLYYGAPADMEFQPYVAANYDESLGTASNKQVAVYLQLRNDEKHGLGIPLPAGRVRVYKLDEADGAQEFIGEDVIQHTPKDEDVLVKVGSAFDIVGERKQTAFQVLSDGHVVTESFEIKLRNHKDQPADVIVKENLYRWSNWEISASSEKWTKQDFRTIHIPVQVPAGGEKTVTYSVRYTW